VSDPADLVTTLRAAEILGVSDGTVRAQIGKGKLGATKLGRDLVIRVDELQRYAREVQPRRRGGRRRV
jgi:excisionase family DNA binding protein